MLINWFRRELFAAVAMNAAGNQAVAHIDVAKWAYDRADAMIAVGGPIPPMK